MHLQMTSIRYDRKKVGVLNREFLQGLNMTTTRTLIVKAAPLDSTLTHVEVVTLFDDKKWSSPAGGWLDSTKGLWLQKPEGVILYLGPDRVEPPAGRLLGLIFQTAALPLSGRFDFSQPEVANGTWELDKII
jgi:hypothetical protein